MPSFLVKKLSKRFSSRRRQKKGNLGGSSEDYGGVAFPIMDLSDDLLIHVLSFVSSAPFEDENDDEQPLFKAYVAHESKRIHQAYSCSPFLPASMSYQIYQAALRKCVEELKLTLHTFGTLTHVLPLVCKRFHELCQLSDGLWKEAMERLIVTYPKIWGKGIRQLFDGEKSDDMDSSSICLRASASCGSSRGAFQRVVEIFQPFVTSLPLVVMDSDDPPLLGQELNLYFNQPRYRTMINEIMEPYPLHERSGSPIASPGRPRFLYSSGLSLPLVAGDPVFVVEITRCELKKNGKVRLSIEAVFPKKILSMLARPNAFDLADAKVQTPMRLAAEDIIKLPVFTSASTVTQVAPPLFCSIELDFGEERYRRMIRELMAGHEPGNERPKFILNYTGGYVTPGKAVLLVEVRKCEIHANGNANVQVVGIDEGTLQDATERPDSNRLVDATFSPSQE